MPQFMPIETLFESTFWNIGALSAILELNEYVEPLFFLAGRELTQHRPKKGYYIHPKQSMASKSMSLVYFCIAIILWKLSKTS